MTARRDLTTRSKARDEGPFSPRTAALKLGLSVPFGPPVQAPGDAVAGAVLTSILLTPTPSGIFGTGRDFAMTAFVDRTTARFQTPAGDSGPVLPPDDEWVLCDAGASDESRVLRLGYTAAVVLTQAAEPGH